MTWYLEALKKYAVFSGRSRRKEYWMYTLFYLIFAVVISLIEGILGIGDGDGIGPLSAIYVLGSLLPTIAVGVRRLHDIGRSGWWLLIGLVPIVGTIVLLIFFVKESDPGPNQYGPNPKAVAAPA